MCQSDRCFFRNRVGVEIGPLVYVELCPRVRLLMEPINDLKHTHAHHPPMLQRRRESGTTVGPILLGFFLFVVVGSAILQIIRTASTGQA